MAVYPVMGCAAPSRCRRRQALFGGSLAAGLFAACEGVDEAHEPFRPMSFSSGPSRRGCRACRRRRCR